MAHTKKIQLYRNTTVVRPDAQNNKTALTVAKESFDNINDATDGEVVLVRYKEGDDDPVKSVAGVYHLSGNTGAWTYLTEFSNEECEQMVEITYGDLVDLMDDSELKPGMRYRITDYVTTTTQEYTQSAFHPFDVIVTATSTDTLSEYARAIQHAGDSYFSNCDLAAWFLLYDINGDTSRFEWAGNGTQGGSPAYIEEHHEERFYRYPSGDRIISGTQYYAWDRDGSGKDVYYTDSETPVVNTDSIFTYDEKGGLQFLDTVYAYGAEVPGVQFTGKGVIYRMVDEWGNDCPYDFKNIMFYSDDSEKYVYTFNAYDDYEEILYDATLINGKDIIDRSTEVCCNNVIKPAFSVNDGYLFMTLNNNIFLNSFSTGGRTYTFTCVGNTFETDCRNNVVSGSSSYNSFGKDCLNNVLTSGSSHNTFGNNCSSNSLQGSSANSFGNNCSSNTLSTSCGFNSFGNSCNLNYLNNNCSYNSFGNHCYSNTLSGNNCSYNSFGDGCYSNLFYGGNCSSNSFGNRCYSNTFNGGNCSSNSFGNNCYSNAFNGGGSYSYNNFGNYCASNTFNSGASQYNNFENNVHNNTIAGGCCWNLFSNGCSTIELGSNSYRNKFGNACSSFRLGGNCNNNTFGNNCTGIAFGQHFSSVLLKNYYRNIRIEDGVSYVDLDTSQTTSASNYIQNIVVASGVLGTSSTYVNISHNTVNDTKQTVYRNDASGTLGGGIVAFISDVEAAKPLIVTVSGSNNTLSANKTFSQITAAINAGQNVYAEYYGSVYHLMYADSSEIYFTEVELDIVHFLTIEDSNTVSHYEKSIPAEQVNADWNATSGKAQILNKPTIPADRNCVIVNMTHTTNPSSLTFTDVDNQSLTHAQVIALLKDYENDVMIVFNDITHVCAHDDIDSQGEGAAGFSGLVGYAANNNYNASLSYFVLQSDGSALTISLEDESVLVTPSMLPDADKVIFGILTSQGQDVQFKRAEWNGSAWITKITPLTPETGKIYYDLGTSIAYCWDNSAYMPIRMPLDNSVTQNSTNAVKSSGIYTALQEKQDKNFIVTITKSGSTYYSDKTSIEIATAYEAGKFVILDYQGVQYYLSDYNNSYDGTDGDIEIYFFNNYYVNGFYLYDAITDGESSISWTVEPNDNFVPSARTINGKSLTNNITLTANDIKIEVVTNANTGAVTQALSPNKFYKFTGALTSLTLTLTASSGGGLDIYAGKFTSDTNTACTLSVPQTVTEAVGNPVIETGKTYEFNIADNVLLMVEI